MDTSRRSRVAALVAALVTLLAGLTLPGAGPASAVVVPDPGWIPWIPPSIDDAGVWVRAFGSSGTTLYAGTEGDGVFRSTDFGITWSNFSSNLPTDSDSVRDIEAGATSVTIATDGGLWTSSNGSTWQPLGQGDGANKLNLPTQTLFSPSVGPMLAGVVGGVYKSSDGGETWTNSSSGLPIGTTVWSIDGFSQLATHLFAATSSGAYMSLDGGSSWSPVTNGLPTGTNVMRVVVDHQSPSTRWYAITSGAGVYRTETAGLIWEPLNDDLPTQQIRSIMLLPIDAGFSDVVIGTNDGVFVSTDKGDHWQALSNTGLDGHTNIWALSTIPTLNAALVAGAQGGGVAYRIMTPPINDQVPVVSGTTQVGKTVSTTDGTWNGTKTITFTYQWQRCTAKSAGTCTDIADATQPTYQIVPADQGKYLRSTVIAENAVTLPSDLRKAYSDISLATIVAPNATMLPGNNVKPNPTVTGDDGTIFPGDVLGVSPGAWNTMPTSFQYQWFRCTTSSTSTCDPIGPFANATSYALTTDDVGFRIAARTAGTNANGTVTSDIGPTTGAVLPLQVTNETKPAVSGKPWVGQTLTRSIGSYSGAIAKAYTTWQVCTDAMGTSCFSAEAGNLGDAGIDTFVLDNGHLGKFVKVTVEVDVNGAEAPQPITVSSTMTGKVVSAPAKVTNTAEPTIIGTPAPGVLLGLTKGTWTGNPTFSYRWLRCNTSGGACTPITGATTKAYTSTPADVGHKIVARVTGVNAWAQPVTVQTDATKTAVAALKPVYETGAAISGTRKVGKTLTVAKGTWSASPAASFTYRWKRNGNNISGATSKSYTLVAADKGKTITCIVTATNTQGSTSKTVNAGVIG